MSEIILSILTPAVPSRLKQIGLLCEELEKQIGDWPVEHLVLMDNRKRTIGDKRDALLRAARGKWVAFSDDDDWIAPDYIASILEATQSDPDVITFNQQCHISGRSGIVEFGLGNANSGFDPSKITKRNAWHVCAWRRSIAILSSFPSENYHEDWKFCDPLCRIPGLREVHIPKVLHIYRHDPGSSLAPFRVDGTPTT